MVTWGLSIRSPGGRLSGDGCRGKAAGGRLTVTMPRDPKASSYGNGGYQQAALRDDAIRTQPVTRPVHPPSEHGGRPPLIIVVVVGLVVALGAAVAVLLLRGPLGGSDQEPAAAPTTAPGAPSGSGPSGSGPSGSGELPVPSGVTGTTTLSDPEINTVKVPFDTPSQWCSLLTADDVRAATGFDQAGAPDATLLCTHYLAGDAGYLFVSDIPASEGAAYLVRGNSAIVYQSDPTTCEVSVALNRGGGVLDIDVRGVARSRVALCEAAALLAARAFDRLPGV